MSGVGSGLVMDWEQESGMLLASGDVRLIRVWDTQKEKKLQPYWLPQSVSSIALCAVDDSTHGDKLMDFLADASEEGRPTPETVRLTSPPQVVSVWDMWKRLRNLKVGKATGSDGISPRIIREFAFELSQPLCDIMNASLCQGEVLDLFKDADVFGSLQGCSTVQYLTRLIHKILQAAYRQGHLTILVPTDFSHAFDYVHHQTAICKLDIPTGADSCVTSLVSDSVGRSLLIAGCGDGSVRLFDRRLAPNECRVMTLREHTGWVVKVFLQKGSEGNIISARSDRNVLLSILQVQADLKWNSHMDSVCTKANQRLYFLRKLKHFHPASDDLLMVYTSYM
ncbi:hypothetical protein Bbelb_440800 [Branchiostoma belcheri]|nr:hypothetical protein Bbelb_440800 [Branchiostoma belcheri]